MSIKDYIERRGKSFDDAFGLFWSKAPNGNVIGMPDLNKDQYINLSIHELKSFLTESITQASEIAVNEYKERLRKKAEKTLILFPGKERSLGFNSGVIAVLKLIKEK